MFTVNDPIFEAIYDASGKNLLRTKEILNAILDVENHNDKLDFTMALTAATGFNPNAEWAAEREAHTKKSDSKKLSKAARDRAVSSWVLNNVKPGMMIKVGGTRDGSGWRKVLRWQTGHQEILECRQFIKYRSPIGRDKDNRLIFDTTWSERPYITDHMPKKVIAVEIDGVWKKVIDLIKEERND